MPLSAGPARGAETHPESAPAVWSVLPAQFVFHHVDHGAQDSARLFLGVEPSGRREGVVDGRNHRSVRVTLYGQGLDHFAYMLALHSTRLSHVGGDRTPENRLARGQETRLWRPQFSSWVPRTTCTFAMDEEPTAT